MFRPSRHLCQLPVCSWFQARHELEVWSGQYGENKTCSITIAAPISREWILFSESKQAFLLSFIARQETALYLSRELERKLIHFISLLSKSSTTHAVSSVVFNNMTVWTMANHESDKCWETTEDAGSLYIKQTTNATYVCCKWTTYCAQFVVCSH